MKLLERLKIIKKIFTADEYFLTIANQHNPYGRKESGPIKYEYFTNSDRELFWAFVHDHIENTKRSITGNFICVRDYRIDEMNIIKRGAEVYLKDGYIEHIANDDSNLVISKRFKHKIPTEEIYSHFKYNDI